VARWRVPLRKVPEEQHHEKQALNEMIGRKPPSPEEMPDNGESGVVGVGEAEALDALCDFGRPGSHPRVADGAVSVAQRQLEPRVHA